MSTGGGATPDGERALEVDVQEVDENDHGILCIGDEFCLQTIPNEFGNTGFVSANPAEGTEMEVYTELLSGENPDDAHPDRPKFSRFILHIANQYSASRQLQKWYERRGGDPEQQDALLESTAIERSVNHAEQRLAIGQRAVYGGVYQLLAPTCGMFLTTQNKPSAEVGTALRCAMVDDQERSKFPWFQINPGFRTRAEGEPVRMGDTVVLRSAKMQSNYLHVNMDPGDSSKRFAEVNFHEEATRFKVVPTAKHFMTSSENSVRAGSYVQLFQPQHEAYLFCDHSLTRSDQAKTKPVQREAVLYNPNGAIGSSYFAAGDNLGSAVKRVDMLWQLNRPTMRWSGSPVKPDTRHDTPYSLRDAVSGLYLSEGSDGLLSFVDSDEHTNARWCLRCFDKDAYEINVEKTGFWIENCQTGRGLGIGEAHERSRSMRELTSKEMSTIDEDDLFVFRALPTQWLSIFAQTLPQVNQLRKFCKAASQVTIEDKAPQKTAHDKDMGPQAMLSKEPQLQALHNAFLIPDSIVKPQWSGAIPKICEGLLARLISSSEPDVVKRSGKVNKQLQEQLTGLQVPQFLLEELLPTIFEMVSEDIIMTKIFGPHLLRMVQYIFRLLAVLSMGHSGNSQYLFSRMATFARYLQGNYHGFGVAECVTEIVSGEPEIKYKTSKEFLLLFWELAMKSRESKYLKFFSALLVDSSSGEKKAVKHNQDRISELLRKKLPDGVYKYDLEHALTQVLARDTSGKVRFKAAVRATQRVSSARPGGNDSNAEDTKHLLEGKSKIQEVIDHVADIDFHTELINMTAHLCRERHRDSIDFFLQDHRVSMSYRRVLARSVGENQAGQRLQNGIPSSIRTAYTLLMRTLFIDREPLEHMTAVQTTRIMPPLGNDTEAVELRLAAARGIQSASRSVVDPYAHLDGVDRPPEGFGDLRRGILAVFSDVQRIDLSDIEENVFLGAVISLAHEMLRFGLFDKSPLPNYLHDGVMTLGAECKELGQELLSVLNGQEDEMTRFLELHPAKDVDPESLRFDPKYTETSTVMEMRKSALALIVDLFGLRASQKIQLLLNTVVKHKAVYSKDIEMDRPNQPQPFETEDSVKHSPNPLISLDTEPDSPGPRQSLRRSKGSAEGSPRSIDRYTSANESLRQPPLDYDLYKHTEQVEVAEQAMEEANKVRVYGTGNVNLTSALLDMMRYTQDLDLCFGAFNALVFFISQNLVFAQTLQRVTILGREEEILGYLAAKRDVSEFRRLRKWLHKKKECVDCMSLVDKLIADWCASSDGQDLLRELHVENYIMDVLQMRLSQAESANEFRQLQQRCMDLVAAICRGNVTNQARFAVHMQTVLLPLLRDKEYYVNAAGMLSALVAGNEDVSVAFSAVLVSEVGQLAQSLDHGRSLPMLQLLQALLVVNEKPVQAAQIKVCKGAVVCPALIETEGDLNENEWCAHGRTGPAMGRYDTIKCATNDDGSEACRRCQLAVAYYSKCLEILGICARGDMPSTELLCASILSFEECILRLNELYHLQEDIQKSSVFITEIKAELLTFFVDVFIDTTSEHILQSVRRARNGIWTVPDGSDATSIATRMIDELRARLDAVKSQPTRLMQSGDIVSVQTLSLIGSSAEEVSQHLFVEVVLFFIHYACCVGSAMHGIAPEEHRTIRSAFTEVRQLAGEAAALQGLSHKEHAYVVELSDVSDAFLQNDVERLDNAIVMSRLSEISRRASDKPIESCENTLAWQRFVRAAASTIPVKVVAGTNRLVGIGIMTLAQTLWKTPHKGSDTKRYASCLVSPLRARIQWIRRNINKGGRDDIPKLLTVLDTVRAIPYSATGFSSDKLDGVFNEFVSVAELDCATNPYLAAVQREMVSSGWAMLCFEILFADELSDLHLTALRLLLAMTGGGNIDVQNTLLKQLTDMNWCPQEIFAASCRKALRRSVRDLKARRKYTQAQAKEDSAAAVSEPFLVGHVVETLSVLSNCCKGAHSKMQDYIRDQPGHQEQFHLITDVVFFINQLERDVKDCVSNESHANEHLSWEAMRKSHAAFHFLCSMATGPHPQNVLAIANSDLIQVINRMLSYSVYSGLADVDSVGRTNQTAKGQIHSQIARLLLILLDGVPQPEVVNRLLGALDWKIFAAHLGVLKDVMKDGTISATRSSLIDSPFDDVVSGDEDEPPSPRAMDETSSHLEQKRIKQDMDEIPHNVCDPEKNICAEWLRKEAYRLFTVVAKLRLAGERMERSGKHAYRNCLGPLRMLLEDDEMMSFFHERISNIEVVRDGILERLFFLSPPNCLVRRDRKMLGRNCTMVADSAPRQDSTEKLQYYLEGAFEHVAVLDSQDAVVETYGKKIGKFLPKFFAWCNRKSPTLILSVLICLNLMASYTQCDDGVTDVVLSETGHSNLTQCDKSMSLSRQSYSRAVDWSLPYFGPVGYELAITLGAIHVIITVIVTYAFKVIRFPVIVEMYDRKDRLEYLRGENTDGGNEREEFIEASVLVYGLPEQVPDDSLTSVLTQAVETATRQSKLHLEPLNSDYVKRLFSGYGEVGVARVVRVHQEPNENGEYKGSGNCSWALVKFENDIYGRLSSAPKRLMDAQERCRSDENPSPLCVSASRRPGAQEESVSVVDLKADEVDRSTTMKEIVRQAMLEYKVANKDLIQRATSKVQNFANIMQVGQLLPIDVIIRFRWDPEVRECLLDIAFAIIGFVYNPLFFSYHLLRVGKLPGARIVIMSMTHNVGRLAVALVLSLLFAWVFAISGLLVFPKEHDLASVENDGGPCGNLLTCFFTYAYASLTMGGLTNFLPGLSFPVDMMQVFDINTSKTLWELLFFMLSTLIGSIITGIICDTFGELRAAQDEAAAYRASTNFITGIPFARTGTTAHHPAHEATNYIQYAWFLLYLRQRLPHVAIQRRESDLTPLEKEILEKTHNGDVSWLPDGRCSLLEDDDASADNTLSTIVSSLEDMQVQHNTLREDMESLRSMMVQTLAQLSGVPGATVQVSMPSTTKGDRSR